MAILGEQLFRALQPMVSFISRGSTLEFVDGRDATCDFSASHHERVRHQHDAVVNANSTVAVRSAFGFQFRDRHAVQFVGSAMACTAGEPVANGQHKQQSTRLDECSSARRNATGDRDGSTHNSGENPRADATSGTRTTQPCQHSDFAATAATVAQPGSNYQFERCRDPSAAGTTVRSTSLRSCDFSQSAAD